MSLRHRRLRAFCAGMVIAVVGCASAPGRNTTPATLKGSIRLSVRNDFGYPVSVEAVGSGATWQLGRVMPASVRDFTVPVSLIANGAVEFVVSSDGVSPVRSGPLLLTAGAIVDFTVARPLYASTAIVRR